MITRIPYATTDNPYIIAIETDKYGFNTYILDIPKDEYETARDIYRN